jgi:hypothetical protein
VGCGFSWRQRATNTIEEVNVESSSTAPDPATVAGITQTIKDTFIGSMEDGVNEFTFTLLGSYQIIKNLQATIYGEYTLDTAEDRAQLGTNRKAEAGLRLNVQF